MGSCCLGESGLEMGTPLGIPLGSSAGGAFLRRNCCLASSPQPHRPSSSGTLCSLQPSRGQQSVAPTPVQNETAPQSRVPENRGKLPFALCCGSRLILSPRVPGHLEFFMTK